MGLFFYSKMANIMKNKESVIVSNKYSGRWIKIPLQCYEIIEKLSEEGSSISLSEELFENKEDKKYFDEIVAILDKIDLIADEPNKKVYYGMIPSVSFAITNKCNLNCCYCCKESDIYKKENLSLNELKKAMDNIIKFKPMNISISGGEPLIRKDFKEFIEYTKEIYDGKLILSTNATLIDEKMAEFIVKNFHAVEISIDGYDEETCSEVRGHGVFKRVVDAVGYLKKYGCQKISMSMVMGKYNESYKAKFEKFNESIGTKGRIRHFCKFGRGFSGCEKYVDDGDVFFTPNDIYDDVTYENIKTGHCNAGRNSIFISDEGYIYSCPNITEECFKVFNILDLNDENEKKLYRKDFDGIRSFEKLDMQKQEKCRDCSVNAFCNTCPAKNKLLFEDKEAFDKYCRYTKEHLNRILWSE